MCEYFWRIRGKKGRESLGEGKTERGREGGMAYHIIFPKDIMIQKQKLINQPVPELSLFSVLSLISSFLLSSLYLSLPPSLFLLQRSWEEAEAAVTQLHQDSLSPSALLCALSSPTYIHFLPPSFSVFWASVKVTSTPSTTQRTESSRIKDSETNMTNLFRQGKNISLKLKKKK